MKNIHPLRYPACLLFAIFLAKTLTAHALETGLARLPNAAEMPPALGVQFNGQINACVTDADGTLYVGGYFTSPTNGLAKRAATPGAAWEAVGDYDGGAVNALAMDPTGNLYVGTEFNSVRKWDGAWSVLGTATGGYPSVRSLKISPNAPYDLYVGGYFDGMAGVANTQHIAKWDGSAWSPLGTGLGTLFAVFAIEVDANEGIFAGGPHSDGTGKLYFWQNGQWTLAAAAGCCASGPGASAIESLLFDPSGNLYVGGPFVGIANISANSVAKYNPSTNVWSPLGSGLQSFGDASFVKTLVFDNTNATLYVGGSFNTAGGSPANGIAKWNTVTNAWSPLEAGVRKLGTGQAYCLLQQARVYAIAHESFSNGTAPFWVAGDFQFAGDSAVSNLDSWSGTAWERKIPVEYSFYLDGDHDGVGVNPVGQYSVSPPPGVCLSPLTDDCDDANPLLFPGNYESCNDMDDDCDNLADEGLPLQTWYDDDDSDGFGDPADTEQKCFGIPVPGHVLNDDDCDDTHANAYPNAPEILDGLDNNCNGATDEDLVQHLEPFPGAELNGTVFVIKKDSAGNIYVGGEFTLAGSIEVNHIAKWDGTAWSALGSGLGGPCRAIAFFENELYAGGTFTEAGGAAAQNIAKWNGTAWSAVGSGLNGTCNALEVLVGDYSFGTRLYAGIGYIGGIQGKLANWDGSAWTVMDIGSAGGEVFSLCAVGTRLWIGGSFLEAGGSTNRRFLTSYNATLQIPSWGFGQFGLTGTVYALTFDAATSTLFIGGIFTGYDPTQTPTAAIQNLAKHVGNFSFLQLVAGEANAPNGPVKALAMRDGHLYAAGEFYQTINGNVQLAGIGKLIGNTWTPLCSGLQRQIDANLIDVGAGEALLATDDGVLVGGNFSHAGGAPAPYFSKNKDVTATDADGDGVTNIACDCNDGNAQLFPGNPETCDGLDNDCDLLVDNNPSDQDNDGWPDCQDCAPADPNLPALFYPDEDGDGFGCLISAFPLRLAQLRTPCEPYFGCSPPAGWVTQMGDCDDNDPNINPADADTDGFSTCAGDCDDNDPGVFPVDSDGDGYFTNCFEGGDCDDNDPALPTYFYPDADGDGFGCIYIQLEKNGQRPTGNCERLLACSASDDYSTLTGDCDDQDPTVFPGAVEIYCNGKIEDCIAANDVATWYSDFDLDGHGQYFLDTINNLQTGFTALGCPPPSDVAGNYVPGWSLLNDDCNDDPDNGGADVNPSQLEICNLLDDDCDGSVDEDSPPTSWFADTDGDGFGDPNDVEIACPPPAGRVLNADDCDDAEAAVSPAAPETCDGTDNNCDGRADEGFDQDEDGIPDCDDCAPDNPAMPAEYFPDLDGDGFGLLDVTGASTAFGCVPPDGHWSLVSGDCDDGNPNINPDAPDDTPCDGIDQNCDFREGREWFADMDADGHGFYSLDLATGTESGFYYLGCDPPPEIGGMPIPAWSTLNDDCDDADALEFPGQIWYRDGDADHYASGPVQTACERPANDYFAAAELAAISGDCNPSNPLVHPGATELAGDEIDQNCDGHETCFADVDNDGYRPNLTATVASTDTDCADFGEAVSNDPAGDCNDANPNIHPGIAENCGISGISGVDDDCDGTIDEDLSPPTARCKSATVVLNASGSASLAAASVNNVSTDICTATANLALAANPSIFGCAQAGTTTTTLTVTDAAGNTATCTANVSVLDILNYGNEVRKNATDGLSGDKMGTAVAVSGNLALAGAPEDKVGANLKQGSAAIFNGAASWVQAAQLIAPDGAGADYFGFALGLDGGTAIVGAYAANIGTANDRGAAYVFTQSGLTWPHTQKLVPSDGIAYDYFGNSVAVGNSGLRALIGAYRAKVGANGSQGAAYIFEKSGSWGQVKKLTQPVADAATNQFFGSAVALASDLALVGATGNASNRGAAYIFKKDLGGAGNWGQVKKLLATDGASGDVFGTSAAQSTTYALVGAPGKASYTGAAYIFAKDQGGTDNWGQAKKLIASDGVSNDRFGQSVAVQGDYTYVGAQANGGKGAVYIFQKDVGGAGNWGQLGKLMALDGAANDQFGTSVAVNSDGTKLAVGANLDDQPSKVDIGSVYFFTGIKCPGSKPEDEASATDDNFSATGFASEILAFPNPFSDELTIKILTKTAAKLAVMDATGRVVSEVQLPGGGMKFELMTETWPAGLYFVQIATSGGVRVLPVAKMN